MPSSQGQQSIVYEPPQNQLPETLATNGNSMRQAGDVPMQHDMTFLQGAATTQTVPDLSQMPPPTTYMPQTPDQTQIRPSSQQGRDKFNNLFELDPRAGVQYPSQLAQQHAAAVAQVQAQDMAQATFMYNQAAAAVAAQAQAQVAMPLEGQAQLQAPFVPSMQSIESMVQQQQAQQGPPTDSSQIVTESQKWPDMQRLPAKVQKQRAERHAKVAREAAAVAASLKAQEEQVRMQQQQQLLSEQQVQQAEEAFGEQQSYEEVTQSAQAAQDALLNNEALLGQNELARQAGGNMENVYTLES
jgi:hypothetical protein